MNQEIVQIAEQLRRAYEGPAWHGPALKPTLTDISEQQASQRSIAGAHTAWEIALHVATWMRIARERLSATEIRDPTEEENWPTPTGSWQEAQSAIDQEHQALEKAILAFPIKRLDDNVPASEPQTFYILLHGVVQHIAYHTGQIVLMTK